MRDDDEVDGAKALIGALMIFAALCLIGGMAGCTVGVWRWALS